ncbi:HD-GYP domain-containing protein [Vibrio breoganii]|uniref:HD-GYP domain-containing protein n=1 Tax=Vibrio breoganii TaxID=553239 RepID=UPI000C8309E0|nr:two-component system response regulator [Vibrio breoganii]PMH17915.1 two-component system response regulator [Vibrio breoganii]PMI19751.1 two-component system response regulator [Vibrio breoganii]PML83614.1 two-component system response regulator [Vibrio breoganii]PMM16447.1 two-component system response regulator [Vibrio breoganii]
MPDEKTMLHQDQDKPLLLIVDDTAENIDVLAGLLKQDYRIRIATNGELALKLAQVMPLPDLILLDIMMPEIDGFEVCRQLKSQDNTQHIPVIFVTAKISPEDEIKGLQLGAVDYIGKPIVPPIAKQRIETHLALSDQSKQLYLKVKEQTKVIKQTNVELLKRLGRAAECKDNETGMHVLRMANYAYILAKSCGMQDEPADLLREAAPMHDIGKIGIPDGILLKKGKLDPEEWNVMRTHVQIGVDILGNCEGSKLMEMARIVALTHHEKWDGTGYPNGLEGEHIPLVGRICAIADVFDALTSARPYKQPWSVEEALQFLDEQKSQYFDATLVDLFLSQEPKIREIMRKYAEPD